ncbi:unnamed protein product [Orchesella dallaii]|uniref:Uncharacterized protein n=1 Tax=Orchesella dallaii TaxID=48710 RepID=A0ABP1QCV0_9HEXA
MHNNLKVIIGVALFLTSFVKDVPVAESYGIRLLELLFRDENISQCITLYIHGSTELGDFEKSIETRDKNFNSYISSMCIKLVVLTSDYNSQILREISRYSDASSVLIFPVQKGHRLQRNDAANAYIESVVYDVFGMSFYLTAHSLFLLIDNNNLFNDRKYRPTFYIQKQPSNMILLTFKTMETKKGRKMVTAYLFYLCYKYCLQGWMKSNEFGKLLPPIHLHKKLLYNANSRSVSVSLKPDTRFIPKNLMSFCQASQRTRFGTSCDFKPLVIASLAMVHNFTFRIFNLRDASETKAFQADTDPYIESPSFAEPENNLEQVYKLMYAQDASSTIYYCRREQVSTSNDNKVMHWIYPFTASVWIILLQLTLGIPSVVTIIFTKSVRKAISVVIGTVSGFIGHDTGAIGRTMFTFISLFGFIICSFYESQITSLAVVQRPLPTIQSLNELISKGYKILKNKESLTERFEIDFKIRSMERVFNKSWFVYGSHFDEFYGNLDVQVELLALSANKLKYASFVDTQFIYYNLKEKTERTRKETGFGDYNCHSIPDEIGRSQYFWLLYVKNQYWLEKTIYRLQSAGLQQRWSHWARLSIEVRFIRNERKLRKNGTWLGESLFGTHSLGPGLVGVEELGSFILLALCPLFASIVCLFLELYYNTKHEILKGKMVVTIVEWKLYRSVCVYPICSKYGE